MWNIGGAVNNTQVFNIILKLNRIKKIITAVYDCYNYLNWMGGRPFFIIPQMSTNTYISRIQQLNRNGISYYHVFSNFYIKEKDLDNPDCNLFLEKTHNPMNGVICSSDILVTYLRKNYPKFKILGSCTIEKRDIGQLQELQNFYDILILPPALNRNYDLIEKLNPKKLEIMVSELCFDDCKVRNLHYELINKWNISHELADFDNYCNFFFGNQHSCFNRKKKEKNSLKLYLKKKEIDKFKDMGVSLFKLQERYNALKTIKNIYRFVIHYSNENFFTKLKMYGQIPNKYYFAKDTG